MAMKRKQSQKEIQKHIRLENYETERNRLLSLGYSEHIGTISIVKANIMAILIAGPIAIIAFVIYMLKWNQFSINTTDFLIFYGLVIVSLPIHELIHGVVWSKYCKNGWKSIHIGVMWAMLTPYCYCKESIKFSGYLLGGLMPLFVLGIGLFVIAFVKQNPILMLLSVFNIVGAGGDITIAGMLRKYSQAKILDHPTECGFIAFTKER